jgi:hypothetical protein
MNTNSRLLAAMDAGETTQTGLIGHRFDVVNGFRSETA